MPKKIYLDYAGTTPMDSRVERVFSRHLKNTWGNASSTHEAGRRARQLIDDSRKSVARVLSCRPDEIVFTGSGTESDNLAVIGIARAYKKFGKHIVTSKIEHPAVLRTCQYLEKNEGFKITYVSVDKNGIVGVDDIKKAIKADTILVSIMCANNEIGTIQPIAEISKAIKEFQNTKPLFHTDACQAAGALNMNISQLGADLVSLNGSKIYGPKATGCLYVRRGTDLAPLIIGGSQEHGLRAGTENPAMIAGFAEALKVADSIRAKESVRLIKLRDYLISQILKNISGSYLNGDANKRLPNNINISFKGVDGEMLMLALDQKGIMVSTGSACTSTSTEPSHVLVALRQAQGKHSSLSDGNIRITLGRQTNKKDINHVLSVLPGVVDKLRR